MKTRIIQIMLLTFALSGCFLRTHKADIAQGNVISASNVKRLHKGQSIAQVKRIMGDPVLINVFTPNRIDYLYTYKAGYGKIREKLVTVHLRHNTVSSVETRGVAA